MAIALRVRFLVAGLSGSLDAQSFNSSELLGSDLQTEAVLLTVAILGAIQVLNTVGVLHTVALLSLLQAKAV